MGFNREMDDLDLRVLMAYPLSLFAAMGNSDSSLSVKLEAEGKSSELSLSSLFPLVTLLRFEEDVEEFRNACFAAAEAT